MGLGSRISSRLRRQRIGAALAGLCLVMAGGAAVAVAPELRLDGHDHRIDPDRWRPLVMSFQQFYGLGERVHPSRLASIDEELYR